MINGLARARFSSEAQLEKTPLLPFLSSCDYWHHSLHCRLPEWLESNYRLLITLGSLPHSPFWRYLTKLQHSSLKLPRISISLQPNHVQAITYTITFTVFLVRNRSQIQGQRTTQRHESRKWESWGYSLQSTHHTHVHLVSKSWKPLDLLSYLLWPHSLSNKVLSGMQI